MLRYYPYLGIERHAAVSETIGDGSTWLAQANLEFWPWIGRIQTLASYAGRWEAGDSGLPDDLNLWSAGVTVYIDSNQRVGVGVEYLDGASKKNGFAQVRRTILGLRAKLWPSNLTHEAMAALA